MTASKRGIFYCGRRFYEGLEAGDGTALFANMVVLRAEPDFATDRTRYLAIHPDFAPIQPGNMVPEYTAKFESDSIYPQWVLTNAFS